MSLSKKIETAANAATIVVAVLLSALSVKGIFFPSLMVRTTTHSHALEIVQGKTVNGRALGVDWKNNQRTLVLAISTTCHYCTESAFFSADSEKNAGA